MDGKGYGDMFAGLIHAVVILGVVVGAGVVAAIWLAVSLLSRFS